MYIFLCSVLVDQREGAAKLLSGQTGQPQPTQSTAATFASPLRQKAAPRGPKPASARGLRASVRARVPAAPLVPRQRTRAPSPPPLPVLKAKSKDLLPKEKSTPVKAPAVPPPALPPVPANIEIEQEREDEVDFNPDRIEETMSHVRASGIQARSVNRPVASSDSISAVAAAPPTHTRQRSSDGSNKSVQSGPPDPHQMAVESFLAGNASVKQSIAEQTQKQSKTKL